MNALLEGGVIVERATSDFSVGGAGGKEYPAGSYVVRAAQAFRPHVLDMFEPQDHPDDFLYPGASPTPPYDNAGWTLAIQMGVEFDRILEGFDGPFEEIVEWNASPMPGTVAEADGADGFLFDHEANDAFTAINRLQASGHEVYWLTSPVREGGRMHPAGTFYVKSRRGTTDAITALAAELGIDFRGLDDDPNADALRLQAPRIALWDTYGGSMPSGWIRWILEQFEYADFELVFPQRLDAGDLSDDYDVIIFPQGAIGSRFQFGGGGSPDPETIPEEYRDRLGRVTSDATLPALVEFLEDGGSIVTIGGSTALGNELGLPLEDHLVKDGEPLGREDYYVPGSILELTVDNSRLVATGVPSTLAVSFNNSPVFGASALAARNDGANGVTPLAWFESDKPLNQRLGVGPGVPPGRRDDGGSEGGQRASVPVRPAHHAARAAARHLQVPLQRDRPLHGGARTAVGGLDPPC